MIAILGATGTIGRSMAREIAKSSETLALYARDVERLSRFGWPAHVQLYSLDKFTAHSCDLVINAIGHADRRQIAAAGAGLLAVSRQWDDRVLATMDERTAYVFLSSGAVHEAGNDVAGGRAAGPALYIAAKRDAEARHRSLPQRSVLDLRVFGYADVCLPVDGAFFLSDLARSVIRKSRLQTSPGDMVRDYVGASELLALIRGWSGKSAPNIALDIYSKAPVAKHELLRVAGHRYGLDIDVTASDSESLLGRSGDYLPRDHTASEFGYEPARSSLEIVLSVIDALLAEANAARQAGG
jgi:nucleoside-diphosphate-sugar epimerase